MADPIVLTGEWLTLSQVAARLDLTTQRIAQFAREGRLRYQITPLGRLFEGASVDEFKAQRDAKNAPPAEPASGEVA